MKKLLFLKPVFNFFLVGLCITTLSRFILFIWFSSRISETENFGLLFPIGLRMDLILLSYFAFLPTVLVLLVPDQYLEKIKGFIRYYFITVLCLFLFMELATPNFLLQYDTRPNRLFVEYLIYPKEVLNMLVKGFWGIIIVAVIVLSGFVYLLNKKSKTWFKTQPSPSYPNKLMMFPVVGFLLFFGARSSLTSIRPINASDAIFSSDQFTNSIALNSLYTVSFAIYSLKNEEDMSKMYGTIPEVDAIQRVKKYGTASITDFTDPEIPLLHLQKSTHKRDKPYNLVIFLQESIGAEYVGNLGGLPLTPNIDKLSKEGMNFTNIYATGTRSVRGIEAVTTGFPPTPSRSVVKLGKSQLGFFSLADILKRKGYKTSFIYGGSANFDNMASFFNGNGFDKIIDEDDYTKDEYHFKGTWGISDEDLVKKANTLYTSYADNEPFFSLMFSSSNHEPFEFPDGRIALHDTKKNTVNNAIKYADYAIGEFFKMAKNESYYNNTVFIVIADHNTRTWGNDLIPVEKFHIPAFIIAPNIEGFSYEKLCSQLDIPPTLLDLIGMDVETPMPGRNLFELQDSIPGRSIMQFHTTNAFRVGDDMVVLQNGKDAIQFKIDLKDNLIPTVLDPELAKDALSHIVTASYLYNEGKYSLPKKTTR